jgi:hypothetical protein
MWYKIATLDKLGLRMTTEAGFRHGGGAVMRGENIEARATRLGITRERVLEELRNIAFSNISDIVEVEEGKLKVGPLQDLDRGQVATIAEIVAAASSGKVYRIKTHDKQPALDLLTRLLDMLPSKTAPQENMEDAQARIGFLIAEIDRLADADEESLFHPLLPQLAGPGGSRS